MSYICSLLSDVVTFCFFVQDGAQAKNIEALTLIDAVMPDVVESKKQAAQPAPKIKTEPASTNGEEATPAEIGK